ncbi:MAG: hypothetical protein K8R53_05615 [Bacteroidales bacterium]|nr:hypothetical protein [Bacteroidales bacterium]
MSKLIYIVLILILCSESSPGQSDLISSKKVPALNGHSFPSFSYIRSSFINTSLVADIGFGTTSRLKIPGISIGDYEIFSFSGRILFLNVGVQYQQRFTPWLAFNASFRLAGRVGTNMSTILADGVNTISGGEIGWLFRILHKQRFNLSGSLNVRNMVGSFINVKQYFEEVINNNPFPSLTKKVPAMSIGGGLQGAYAFSPVFGIQFFSEYAYGESFERQKTKGFFASGIVGDVDFLPNHKVPIGLALGYTATSAPEIVLSDGGFSNVFMFKIGYTGSEEFELGLQYIYFNTRLLSVDKKPFISKTMLLLKFYF